MALTGVGQTYLWSIPGGGGGGPSADVARFNYRFYPIIVFLIWLFN